MKAVVYSEYGSNEVLKLVNDIAKPEVTEGIVVVEIRAAGINPFDASVRSGAAKANIPLVFPKIIGMDISGVISGVGQNVKEFGVGQEVYGQAAFFAGGGAVAEFSIAKPGSLAAKPNNISFLEAAAHPLTAVSAYQALVDNMSLRSGQKLLIQGGAGGIGSIAIQLAKHFGAYVAVTCAAKDVDYVKGLGADVVINYEAENFVEKIQNYDYVFDLVGGDVYRKSFEVLKNGGIIISMREQPNDDLSERYGVKARHQMTNVDTKSLDKIRDLVETGTIKPKIEKDFPIEQTAAAFDLLEHNHPKGKVVIKIKD